MSEDITTNAFQPFGTLKILKQLIREEAASGIEGDATRVMAEIKKRQAVILKRIEAGKSGLEMVIENIPELARAAGATVPEKLGEGILKVSQEMKDGIQYGFGCVPKLPEQP